jgi:hypothetical protein
MLNDPAQAAQMGRAARAHTRKNYVGDLHLLRYEPLFSTLISEG